MSCNRRKRFSSARAAKNKETFCMCIYIRLDIYECKPQPEVKLNLSFQQKLWPFLSNSFRTSVRFWTAAASEARHRFRAHEAFPLICPGTDRAKAPSPLRSAGAVHNVVVPPTFHFQFTGPVLTESI